MIVGGTKQDEGTLSGKQLQETEIGLLLGRKKEEGGVTGICGSLNECWARRRKRKVEKLEGFRANWESGLLRQRTCIEVNWEERATRDTKEEFKKTRRVPCK